MRIALLSDVHANLEALEACLRHASAQRVDRHVFLGDHVGYGADPGAVVDRIAGLVSQGAIAIKGNHDEAVAGSTRELNDDAHEAIEWTRGVISPGQKKFLSDLPLCVRDGDSSFVHASADFPDRWKYVLSSTDARESIEAAGTVYTFSGHVHDQVLYFKTMAGKTAPFRPTSGSVIPVPSHRGWLALVGSVGQPRDGNPAAAYALFDAQTEEITFFRVPYDATAAATKIRSAGLPAWIAQRIESGL